MKKPTTLQKALQASCTRYKVNPSSTEFATIIVLSWMLDLIPLHLEEYFERSIMTPGGHEDFPTEINAAMRDNFKRIINGNCLQTKTEP